MKISIAANISSRIYKNKQKSFGLIFDELKHVDYCLKGHLADLWNIILYKKDFEYVFQYAKENNLEQELNQLLSELKHKKFIDISIDLPFSGYKYLTTFVKYDVKNNSTNELFYQYIHKMIYANNSFKTLTLQLSYNCDLKCRHCFNPKNKNNEQLDFEICKKAIDEADELGVIEVSMTGGECTINKDFLKIAQYVRSKHISLTFLTNGQKLYDDKNLLQEIIKIYPFQIQLSLYSMNPEIHDSITGKKGSHFKTLSVIKELRKANIGVAISCPVLNINKNDYKEVFAFAKKWDIKLRATCLFINNPDNHNDYLKVDNNVIEQFYIDLLKEEGNNYTNNKGAICNSSGIWIMNIAPNLDITPCNDFNYRLGNLKTDSLKSVRENALTHFVEKFYNPANLKGCFTNDYCEYCCYAPEYVYLYENKEIGRYEPFCAQAKAYKKALKLYNNK